MKIEIFDPPMCCSSGVCGPSVDPKLSKLQEILRKIEQAGVGVQRFNLASEPQAFVDNAKVAQLLRYEGNAVLPLTFVEGTLLVKGRYLDAAEFEQVLRAGGIAVEPQTPPKQAAGCGCKPGECC